MRPECAATGCEKPSDPKAGFGYCRTHYANFKRFGDALRVGRDFSCTICAEVFQQRYGRSICFSPECIATQKAASMKDWYERNQDRCKEYKSTPTYREYAREYARRYREENLDLVRQRFREWEERNPHHTTDWMARNIERARETVRRYRARRRGGKTFVVTERDTRRLYHRQEQRCAYCREDLNGVYDVDHILPLSRGGSNGIGNIALACGSCNSSKSNWLLTEWRYKDLLKLRKPVTTHYPIPAVLRVAA